MKYNVRIVYSYDGSYFYGFQRQKKLKTVQGTIEDILKKVFNEEINLISSGRTDTGVHANMQVSNFFITKNLPLDKIQYVINKDLNNRIYIDKIEYVDINFHSRYMVKKRTYKYRLATIQNISVFEKNYVSIINKEIDINEINKIAKQFIGTHNFQSFMKKNEDVNNFVRTIYDIHFIKQNNIYEMYITGNAFLHSMVRIIMGTILAIYFKEVSENYINFKLNNNEVDKPKKICSPNGLYLHLIEY